MEIIETPVFTKIIRDLMPDEQYRALQNALIVSPDIGKVIKGSGGLRKLRLGMPGRGKRGGARVIYYWYTSEGKLLMLYAYAKSKEENLTPDQIKILRSLIEEDM